MTIGSGVFLVGLALHFWSKGCLVRTWTVTTWGPYKLVRHPFYLANFLIDEGICLISGNLWLAALYVVAFLFVYLPTIRKEERHLTRLHGDAFTSYARAVPALVPYRLHVIFGPPRLSWANIKRERETSRLLRILAIPWYFIIASTLFHETPYNHTGRAVLLCTAMSLALVLNVSSVMLRRDARAMRPC
ncbi:MAG: isoprenylcysteine carboxylmethyltransferase family protein [Phycisphaerae bacterium]